jgi:hypothetical protein
MAERELTHGRHRADTGQAERGQRWQRSEEKSQLIALRNVARTGRLKWIGTTGRGHVIQQTFLTSVALLC